MYIIYTYFILLHLFIYTHIKLNQYTSLSLSFLLSFFRSFVCFSLSLPPPLSLATPLQVKARMLRASLEIKAWCKEHSKYRLPSRWHLSKTRLSLKRGKFVHYVGKGWHVSVILGFLRDFMENLNVDSDLKMLVWSGDELMSFLHAERQNRGLLLTEAGIHQVTVLGDFHLKMLLVASQKHTGFPTYRLFNVRPKFHGMSHILDFASTGRNPVTQSCWMEEDWVRKVANLAKRTHARKTKLSTLQRYSAGVAFEFGMR